MQGAHARTRRPDARTHAHPLKAITAEWQPQSGHGYAYPLPLTLGVFTALPLCLHRAIPQS